MEDQSILGQNSGTVNQAGINEYANELIKQVCLQGDSLSKYQKQIEKRFGGDFYTKCNNFVEEVHHSVESGKFSNTSVVNLKYLAKEIGIPVETVDEVVAKLAETREGKGGSGNTEDKKKSGGINSWIILLFLVILTIGCYFVFSQNEKTPAPMYDDDSSLEEVVDTCYADSCCAVE